jgi:glycosyltransferase involved in cell wall biosynthesis
MAIRDLSILIPARNEEFLNVTILDLLSNMRGNTEIIVVLDGYETQVVQNPRVTVITNKESIGQRAATNQAAKISMAKYLMKVDAHCAFDQGFDVKMIQDMQDNWTMIPAMRNLHAFNWVCKNGHSRYQGPSGPCKECNEPTKKDIVWIPKTNPLSTSYCFDQEPHFQYFREYKKRPEYKRMYEETKLTDSMSIQGSCFMVTRDKYWELNLSDETFGSWGSQGIEVACKTWLSGGRVVINHKTWYAHMFRTQGGDFGFPYPQSGKQIARAKKTARELFFDNKWDKQIYPLSWLIERFWPVPGWTEEMRQKIKDWKLPCNTLQTTQDTDAEPPPEEENQETHSAVNKTYGVVYYTDNRLDAKIMKSVQDQIRLAVGDKKIISVSLQPIDFGENIVLNLERSYATMFKQILAGLEALDTDYVFLCEHDILYHASHFDFVPQNNETYYYDMNTWQVRATDGFAVKYDCKRLSQLCANRKFLINHYKKRVELVEKVGFTRRMGFEPGTHGRPERVDDFKAEGWLAKFPSIDIKHGKNATEARFRQDQFRSQRSCRNWQESTAEKIEGWSNVMSFIK